MRRVLNTITVLSLLAAGMLGLAVWRSPQIRLDLWPRQSFTPVPEARRPEAAAAWQTSVRQLDRSRPWPDLSPVIRERINEKGGADFPILVPAEFTDHPLALAASHFRIELLIDGYYAIFQSAHMEVTILGTARVHHAEGMAPQGIQADYLRTFQDPGPRPAGGRITFGAYGADYSVTFDCKVTDPGLKQNCINDDGARAFVAALMAGEKTHLKVPVFEGS